MTKKRNWGRECGKKCGVGKRNVEKMRSWEGNRGGCVEDVVNETGRSRDVRGKPEKTRSSSGIRAEFEWNSDDYPPL